MKLRREETILAIKIGGWVAVVLLIVLAIPIYLLISYEINQARNFHDEVRIAAIINCREIETLKYQNRREAWREYRQRFAVAEFLDFEISAEVEREFQKRRDRALARNKAKRIDCRNINLQEELANIQQERK